MPSWARAGDVWRCGGADSDRGSWGNIGVGAIRPRGRLRIGGGKQPSILEDPGRPPVCPGGKPQRRSPTISTPARPEGKRRPPLAPRGRAETNQSEPANLASTYVGFNEMTAPQVGGAAGPLKKIQSQCVAGSASIPTLGIFRPCGDPWNGIEPPRNGTGHPMRRQGQPA
jgi:hypothetical protein